MLPATSLEELARFDFCKTRIARFDDQEKAVVGGAPETFPIEKRMIWTWQAVHDKDGKKCGEGGEKNGELEHDREKRRHGSPIVGFSVHDQGIKSPGWSELHQNCSEQ